MLRGALVGGTALAVVIATVELDPERSPPASTATAGLNSTTRHRSCSTRTARRRALRLALQESTIIISTNGKPDASIEMNPERARSTDEITMVMAAAVPLAYNPGAKTVANIGLGSGLTAHTFLGKSSIERVDTIEIESAMIKAARGFGDRVSRTFEDPRSSIHLEDAKTFFSLENRAYDIIVAEPSNPWVSGVASLFSEEFYRTVPNYLAPDGLFVQWLQLYEFNDRLAQSVLKALSASFSDFVIYNTDYTNILIVAKAEGTLGTPSFNGLIDSPLRGELAHVGLRSASDFSVRKTGSRRLVDAFLADSPDPGKLGLLSISRPERGSSAISRRHRHGVSHVGGHYCAGARDARHGSFRLHGSLAGRDIPANPNDRTGERGVRVRCTGAGSFAAARPRDHCYETARSVVCARGSGRRAAFHVAYRRSTLAGVARFDASGGASREIVRHKLRTPAIGAFPRVARPLSRGRKPRCAAHGHGRCGGSAR